MACCNLQWRAVPMRCSGTTPTRQGSTKRYVIPVSSGQHMIISREKQLTRTLDIIVKEAKVEVVLIWKNATFRTCVTTPIVIAESRVGIQTLSRPTVCVSLSDAPVHVSSPRMARERIRFTRVTSYLAMASYRSEATLAQAPTTTWKPRHTSADLESGCLFSQPCVGQAKTLIREQTSIRYWHQRN